MSLFKQSQYQIITAVVNRVAYSVLEAKLSDPMASHPKERTWQMGHQIIESFVDELCIEFAKDNTLFNETLFRAQCGNLISNEHAIIDNDIDIEMG